MEYLIDALLGLDRHHDVSWDPFLKLQECYESFRDAVGSSHVSPSYTQILQPSGGIFYYQHAPILFLHVVDLSGASEDDEASYFAECAMMCRAAEMFFAGQSIYPVLLAIQGGSATFWKYMEILQLGRKNSRNISKIYGHCVPIVTSYTSVDDILVVANSVLDDAKRSIIVPAAER